MSSYVTALIGEAFGHRCGGHDAEATVVEADPIRDVVLLDCVHDGGADGRHGFEMGISEMLTLVEGQ